MKEYIQLSPITQVIIPIAITVIILCWFWLLKNLNDN